MHSYQPLRIAAVGRETAEAAVLSLDVPPALAAAFRFEPGQHLPVRATIAGAEQRRTYSICCGPAEERLRIAIKRVAGGLFSNWANDVLKAGDTLEVMPPAGRFVLPDGAGTARHVVAFAAGVGITPVLAMVKHALAREPETRVTLLYGNRGPDTILFAGELDDLKDRHLGRFTLLHALSHSEEGGAPLLEGRITADKVRALAGRLFDPAEVAHAFLCGPAAMIKDVRAALMGLGMPAGKVHFELFAPASPSSRSRGEGRGEGEPGAPISDGQGSDMRRVTAGASSAPDPHAAEERGEGGAGAEVVAVVDGIRHRFTVAPGAKVVDSALAAGVRVPFSCKGGMCCTCRARVVEGEARMAVNYSLEPWEIERGFILTCQAVPMSERLVLDYDQM
jgi:ring-1,2-phenylacetyl-CoA epoxidase subunit PaaE